jgi:hypothetical protein
MKKLLFSSVFLLLNLVLADYCLGLDLMGPQEPAPYGVFSTISADSPAKGQAAIALSIEKSLEPDFFRFSSQISLGITDNIALSANIPYVDNSHSGLEDIAVTLKHRFFEKKEYELSVAYLLTGSVASSTEELSADGRVGAGIVSTKRVGPVEGHINFIYSYPGDDDLEDEIRFSVGVEFAAAHSFDLLAEVFGRKSHFSDEIDELEARFGYRVRYSEGVYTTLGAGFGFDNRAPDFRVMASLSVRFPNREVIEKVYEEGE